MDPLEIERQAEFKMIRDGVERWERHQARLIEKDKHWDTKPASDLVKAMSQDLLPLVKSIQSVARKKFIDTLSSGRRLAGWEMDMLTLDPMVVAYITMRTVITYANGVQRHILGKTIGDMIRLQVQWERMQQEERTRAKEGYFNRIEGLKRTVKEVGPRSVRKWIRKLDDLSRVEWDYETTLHLGLVIADELHKLENWLTVEHTVDRNSYGAKKTVIRIRIKDELLEEVKAKGYALALQSPWMQPMICKPRDWTPEGGGGYLEIKNPLVKHGGFEMTGEPDQDMPLEVLQALNSAQSVPWRINKPLLEVALRAQELGLGHILPVAPLQELPPSIPEDTWATMSKAERGKVNAERHSVHANNNRLGAKRDAMNRALAIAVKYQDLDRFFFPHNMDWRGRFYPLTQDLHPQGDDLCRGLLQFAEGKPVGTGGQWICHAVAAAYGEDKLTLDEQVRWCQGNSVALQSVARDPLGAGLDWLVQAEEPWQFLAACQDYCGWLAHGQEWVSHLPVHVDGSCNGLQHLSALGRDPVGAAAVNLTSDPQRQDIYQIVADKVAGRVADDHFAVEQSLPWRGKVTRKTVKRAVMTTPYGVTPAGIRQQLIDDRICDGLEGDRMENANYMRDCIMDAVADTVIEGRKIMQWMQDVASELAVQNKAIRWHAPTGMRITQEYRNPETKVLRTLVGRVSYYKSDKAGQIKKTKAAHAIAPNVVHSMDAAHMCKTVNAMAGASLALVHDSYGTHAADVDRLQKTLRDEFVDLYSVDWLSVWAASWARQLGYLVTGETILDEDGEWVYPPARGDFDIEEVRNAPWMFF